MLGCKAHPCLESSLPGPTGCARFASAPCCSRACTASCLRGFTWRGGEGKGERAFAVMKTSLKPKGSKPKANHTTKPDTVTALKPSDDLRSPGSGFSEHPRLHSFETPDFGLTSFFYCLNVWTPNLDFHFSSFAATFPPHRHLLFLYKTISP